MNRTRTLLIIGVFMLSLAVLAALEFRVQLLHPRMATELQSANATDWARVFAGPGGADPYGGACGELYMDCFDRGGFPGKGILDVRALLDCCGGGVIPEGRVLSHDALEGAYLHGGFLGDGELTDISSLYCSNWFRPSNA